MKILVTGAAGFIGSHLSEHLATLGHSVVGVDCFTSYYSKVLKELNAKEVEKKGVTIHRLDLADSDLSSVVEGVEIVYHLAAQPGISDKVPFEVFERNNILATYNLIKHVKDLSTLKCLVNTATSSVYGKFAQSDEEAAPKPTSFYGVTKLASEQLVLSYFRDVAMPACSMRLFSVYGERERPDKGYHRLIRSIVEDKEFILFEGSEKHERSFTYVSDIVDGLTSAIENLDKCIGEIFNLGCDVAITTGDGIKIVEEALGRKAKIVVGPKRPGDQEKTLANIEKARKVLGYNPKVLPKEGLKREALWYKDTVFGKVTLD